MKSSLGFTSGAADKPAVSGIEILTIGSAQGFSPTNPAQELIYFNGRLVALEQRGPNYSGNAVKAGGNQSAMNVRSMAAAPQPGDPTSGDPPSGNSPSGNAPPAGPPSFPAPPLPVPGALPQDTSTNAFRINVTTPAATHISPPLGSH